MLLDVLRRIVPLHAGTGRALTPLGAALLIGHALLYSSHSSGKRLILDKGRVAGQAGPMFQGFQFPKTILIWFEAHPGSAGWMQAIVAGIAIVAVYLAATIPVRAEAKAKEAERRLRAWGLALLLTPEIIVLKGEIETCIDSGTIYDAPVQVPASLITKTDQLYLLGETGGRLLQAIGMVNGVAAQTRRYQAAAISEGVPLLGKAAAGGPIWQNNLATLRLCLMNLDEVIKQIKT